jgi:hypothetical protein
MFRSVQDYLQGEKHQLCVYKTLIMIRLDLKNKLYN